MMAAAAEPLREGALEVQLDFANAVTAQVRVNIDLPEDPGPDQVFRTRVVTEHGELDLNGYGHLWCRLEGEKRLIWTQPPFDPRDAADPIRLEAFATMLQGFIDCIVWNRAPPVTGDEGRLAVALFQAARRASAEGRPLALPLAAD